MDAYDRVHDRRECSKTDIYKYWVECCERMGMVDVTEGKEDEEGGGSGGYCDLGGADARTIIRFRRDMAAVGASIGSSAGDRSCCDEGLAATPPSTSSAVESKSGGIHQREENDQSEDDNKHDVFHAYNEDMLRPVGAVEDFQHVLAKRSSLGTTSVEVAGTTRHGSFAAIYPLNDSQDRLPTPDQSGAMTKGVDRDDTLYSIEDDAAAAMAMPEMDALPPAFTAQDEQQELATLSPSEITTAEADLRGITLGLTGMSIVEDTVDQISRRAQLLYCLDSEVSDIPNCHKMAYLEAVVRCPEIMTDEHKIAFLEREDFNAKLAAQRLVKYWETKLAVFGPERCFLPLTLRGAMKDELAGMLKHCPYQVMPVKDTAGRAILFFDPGRRDVSKYSTDSAMMAFWYMVEAATEDPEVREKGIVILNFAKHEETKHFDPALARFIDRVWDILPVACRSIHVFYPSFFVYYFIFPVAKRLMGRESRQRLKMHQGATDKILRDLEGYCLLRDRVPADLGGDAVLDLDKWVNDRLVLEHQREVSRGEDVDQIANTNNGRRAGAKRMRRESVQSVCDGVVLRSTGSCLFPTGNDAELSASILATSQNATSTCNESFCNSTSDASFQGDPPNSAGGDRVGHERRDSFYDSIMELPGIEDLGTADISLIIADATPSIDQSLPQGGSKKKRKGRIGDPRMDRAVMTKLANPEMSSSEALSVGGFEFPSSMIGGPPDAVLDSDNVSLQQRRNQLSRRLRQARKGM